MTPEQEAQAAAALKAEELAQQQASQRLAAELAAVAAVLIAAGLRNATPDVLRTLIRRLLTELTPAAASALEVARSRGVTLGRQLAGETGLDRPPLEDEALQRVIDTSDSRAGAHLDNAIVLSTQLPMTDRADVMAVLGKARSALNTQKADAAWVTHRSIALGVAEVARERGRNVVWVAERDACLHCLAYQGRVTAPGVPFPPGLTYADKALVQFGLLLGPPLHPHCRCQLELTDLEAGTLDVGLAREAARSVARGLTDHASEPARFRAADRLVKSATSLLPKSVLDQARRNIRDGVFKDRPDSTGAKAEIARRNQARADRGPVKRSAPPAPAPVLDTRAQLKAIAKAKNQTVTPLLGGESNRTDLVTLPDGRKAVRKTIRPGLDEEDNRFFLDGEELVSLLGDAVRAPIATVYRENSGTAWVEFVDGSTDVEGLIDGPDGVRIGLVDAMTAYIDRLSGLRNVDGRLVAFDSGGSWLQVELNGVTPDPFLGENGQAPSRNVIGPGNVWRKVDLPLEELEEIRARMRKLRPAFRARGRDSWLTYSLNVLDALIALKRT